MVIFPAKKSTVELKGIKRRKWCWMSKIRQDKPSDGKQDNIFYRYCENTSVHGMRYLLHEDLHWTERLFWAIMISIAFYGAISVSILISTRYQTSPLSTVVESTNVHVYEIPFTGLSICNSHRVNKAKINGTIERYLPNASKEDIENFYLLLNAMEVLDFGSFEEFDTLVTKNVTGLEKINITRMMIDLHYTCEELFIICWWQTNIGSCCEKFKLQKTEYGFCYSFNSASNIEGPLDYNDRSQLWRTTSFGEWSGFRGLLRVYPGLVRRYSHPPGILVIAHHPYEWPQQAKFIPEGTSISIGIQPTAFYASSDVKRLTSEERQCIYQGFPYLRANCMAECRQRAMVEYCNCTVDLFYPYGVYEPCNISGFMCLNRFNDIFNYEKPPIENDYFDVNEEGLICPCLPECSRIDYSIEVVDVLGMDASNDSVAIDVHFKSSTMLRYRTDVTFGWLDLMVAFGGIAGLFLGCSLLSGAELIYYLTIGLFCHSTKSSTKSKPEPKEIQRRINTVSHGIEHVQHQWRLAGGNMFIVEAKHLQTK